MDEHAGNKQDEHGAVLLDHGGDKVNVPVGAYLVHHVLGGVPGLFVGKGGVKVGAASEEKAGESDEHKCLENVPGAGNPLGGGRQFKGHHNAFRRKFRGR